MNLKTTVCSLFAVLFLISCDDNTSGLGGSLTPQDDVITVKDDSCFAVSRTIPAVDSLTIMSSVCCLGRYTEQNSGATFESGYLTQIGCMENLYLADSVYGIGDHVFPEWFVNKVAGQKPYYANIKLYYKYFFGSPENSIKIEIFPLDRMMDSQMRYYPDIDPDQFCDTGSKPLASITVSGNNMQNPDSIRSLSGYYPSITVPLPDSIAGFILESYFDPSTRHYFADATSFMNNVLKGFYVRCTQGDGTILFVDRTVLEVNFKFIGTDKNDEPTVESLMAEFSGNSEVIQANCFRWTGLDAEINDNTSTWIRSPFGVLTEITLPIDDMRSNEYVLNSAMLRLSTSVTPSATYKPSVPSYLLLIRKDRTREFFSKNSLTDNTESYVASYSSKYGTYTYENIAAMVEKIYNDRSEWLEENGKTLQNGGLEAYEQAYPDWNKVLLIPVTPILDSRNAVLNYTLDISLHQVKLIGGDTPIKIKTIRSRF